MINRSKLFRDGSGVLVVILSTLPSFSYGADEVGLEEIVVTATRREASLQDVPMAVSAISGTELAEQSIFETSDLNGAIPNLQVASPYGTQQPNFTIRGVGVGTEFNANTASPVGVYVDEVYQTFRASHGQQLYDLERIEVLRGPQGTLFGRNTTGGAVNFITRKPQLDGTKGNFSVGYGNYERKSVLGAVEFTPVDGVFGVRLAGTYVENDPYVDNVLPAGLNTSVAGGASGLNRNSGISPGGPENYGVRATLRLKPTDAIDVSLKVYSAESDGGNESPIPSGQSTSSDVVDWTDPQFLFSGAFAALGPAGLVPTSYSQSGRGLDVREIEADTVGRGLIRANGAVLNGRVAINDELSLIGIFGYDEGDYETWPITDCDGTPLAFCNSGYNSEFEGSNVDIRFDYQGEKLKWTAGVYYGDNTIESRNTHNFFSFLSDLNTVLGSAANYWNPFGRFNGSLLPVSAFPTGISASQNYEQAQESWSVYGEAVYPVIDTVRITLGLRYSDDTLKLRDAVSTFFDDAGNARMVSVSDFRMGSAFAPYFLDDIYDAAGNVVATASTLNGGAPMPGPLNGSKGTGKLSGRLIVDWQITDDVLTYASYSHGFRSGAVNGHAYGSANELYFVPPEEIDAYEVGWKSNLFDRRLELNGAVFFYDYTGQQGQILDQTVTGNLTSLDGEVTGAELETRFAATDTLMLTAAAGWLDTEYDSTPCPGTPLTGHPAQLGSCVSSIGGPVNIGGNPFPFAADWTFNAGFDWEIAALGAGVVRLRGDASYTGQYYYDAFEDYAKGPLPNLETGKLSQGEGEYWLFDARLSFETEHYSVAVWGKNLADEEYYPYGIATSPLFGVGYRVIGAPRTYGVEFSYSF